jgi:hypothetical protein
LPEAVTEFLILLKQFFDSFFSSLFRFIATKIGFTSKVGEKFTSMATYQLVDGISAHTIFCT